MDQPGAAGSKHLVEHLRALVWLDARCAQLERWASRLSAILLGGGRLLAAGNGGSAAEAQHLTAELVGRFKCERQPLSALALHADSSSLTAIANDYGYSEAFARQVRAHGRRGDAFMAFSTSGRSLNLMEAIKAARELGLTTWALTGPAPNPLSRAAHESICVDSTDSAVVQEMHLVAVHMLCEAVEAACADPAGRASLRAV